MLSSASAFVSGIARRENATRPMTWSTTRRVLCPYKTLNSVLSGDEGGTAKEVSGSCMMLQIVCEMMGVRMLPVRRKRRVAMAPKMYV